MESRERVEEYVSRVETVANQLGRNGEELSISHIVEKILRNSRILCVQLKSPKTRPCSRLKSLLGL